MSVQKHPDGRRSIQVEVEVPGTPEEVWQAIATGPGISSWFVPTEIETGKDGIPAKLILHFGPGMDSVADITAWDAPRRFAATSTDFSPGGPTMATEWIVEAKAGGVCLVRVVHSLFADTDDWDNQLEGTESGWPAFFLILREYLSRYKGQPCRAFYVMAFAPGPESNAWSKMTGSLGLAGTQPGRTWTSPAGPPPMSGVTELVPKGDHHPHLLLHLDRPSPGIAIFTACGMGDQTMLGMSCYFYGDRAAETVARDEPGWQSWMKERLGVPVS